MTRNDFNAVITRLARRQGHDLKLPKDLSVFFPQEDGRQDLMYTQDFGLDGERPLYARARKLVLSAALPAARRDLLTGYLDLFLGEYGRAENTLRPLCRAESGYWPHFLHACAIWLKGDKERTREFLPKALDAVEAAIAADSRQRDAYVIRAGLRREMEDVPGRLADAERVLRMDPDFVWARTERAEVLGETGRYRLALRDLNFLIRRYPRKAWAWAQRARLRGISGYYTLALEDFNKAVSLDPHCGPLLAWRGETFRRLGRAPEALADLDRAIELDPGYRLAHAWRGRIKLLQGRYDEAISDFNETLRLEPREMLAQAWRGEAWWKLGRFSSAVSDFDAIYPAEPQGLWNARLKTGETQENYFMLSAPGGRRESAFWKDLAAGARDGDPWALAFRGRCLVSAGLLTEALQELNRAVEARPRLAWAYAWRGEAHRRLGNFPAACADLKKAVKSRPAHPWSWAWLGKALFDSGKPLEALSCYDKALVTPEQRYALVHVWRGEVLWTLGRRDESASAFRKAFHLDGKCKEAAAWVRRLEPGRGQAAADGKMRHARARNAGRGQAPHSALVGV